MLKSILLMVLRRLAKERSYVLINLISLTIGIASFIVLVLYLRNELGYDQHQSNHERIYRVVSMLPNDGLAVTAEGYGPILIQDYPQLGEYLRFRSTSQNSLAYGSNRMTWDNIYLADDNLFQVFDHDIIYGNPETALSSPGTIAISQSMAQAYFGDRNPIGEVLESDVYSYQVTLVFADLPGNSHFKYDAIFPYSIMGVFFPDYEDEYLQNLWSLPRLYTYLFTPPEFDPATFPDIAESFFAEYMEERGRELDSALIMELQPLASIHYGRAFASDFPIGNIFYIYAFGAVALFLLLVACINYINLATARAAKRAKEIGMRKVFGASQGQLITQFMAESLVFVSFASIFALAIDYVVLNAGVASAFLDNSDLMANLDFWQLLAGVIGLTVVIGLLSGLYPAFYLSSISPMASLANLANPTGSKINLRQILVLIQLAVSIGVIVSALIMNTQLDYIANKPLGFEKDNIVLVELQGADAIERLPTIKNEMRANTRIVDVTHSFFHPGTGSVVNILDLENNEGAQESATFDSISVGLNYVNTLEIELVEGRLFLENSQTDETNEVLVNETMVEMMDWEQPIGKLVGNLEDQRRVIGVVRDFNYGPLHTEIRPLMIWPLAYNFENMIPAARAVMTTNLVIKITGEDLARTLDDIENIVRQFSPESIFNPIFLDTELSDIYVSETNLMRLNAIFASICILISIVGLFGLSAFTTQQRFKEIGVRKVLGASNSQIVFLLTRNLMLMIVLAGIPTSLIAYYALNNWLESFAYRADISLFPFLLATGIATFIAYTTIGLQAARGSKLNPVDALRYE